MARILLHVCQNCGGTDGVIERPASHGFFLHVDPQDCVEWVEQRKQTHLNTDDREMRYIGGRRY